MEPLIAAITSHIWLGNIRAAMDDTLLKKHSIGGSLNLSELQYMTSRAELFACPLRDNENNLTHTLLAATYMLDELLARHARVLVHCHHGGSRSVAVVMLWLCRHEAVHTFDEARNFIQGRYPLKLSVRQPRPGLMTALNQLKDQGLLS